MVSGLFNTTPIITVIFFLLHNRPHCYGTPNYMMCKYMYIARHREIITTICNFCLNHPHNDDMFANRSPITKIAVTTN